MTLAIIITVGLLLAFGNGANDNFKGVATLYGSDTTSYRSALIWATVTTGPGDYLARGSLVGGWIFVVAGEAHSGA